MHKPDDFDHTLVAMITTSIRTLNHLITQLEQAAYSRDGKTALLKLRVDLAISQKDLAKMYKRIARLRDDSD